MTDQTSERFSDIVDEVTPDTLKELAGLQSPVVSLMLPTHRDRIDTRHDSLILRNLAQEAAGQLRDQGADADAVLAPIMRLVDDGGFWRRQGDGLAVFADAEQHHVFRVPRRLPQLARVGAAPLLWPLFRVASGDEAFYILAFSQKSVRLFEGSRDSIHELELTHAPASMDEMERSGTKEPELQHQSSPGGAIFHGHGGADTAATALQKFVAEVAAGVRRQLGADNRQPLVLAAVAEHLPLFQATGQLPTLVDEVVAGNPDRSRPDELLAGAWPVARGPIEARRAELAERLGSARGTGSAVTDPAELRRAAEEGRVETLLAPVEVDAQSAPAGEDADLAVVAALRTGATIAVSELPEGVSLAALLRF
ncbi:hypothetical protein [Enemella sp. A6]|uniref:baeRF3 domain-containing protein n=1 Tax=Enemella sp. A6 TaxID=3440152 RepID=UPI003EB763EC